MRKQDLCRECCWSRSCKVGQVWASTCVKEPECNWQRQGWKGRISIPLVSDSAGVNGKFSVSLDILSSARDASPYRTSVQPLGTWGDFKGKQVTSKCCTASGCELEHCIEHSKRLSANTQIFRCA